MTWKGIKMKEIIISPYSRKAPDLISENPKNYPYWKELVEKIKTLENVSTLQVGVRGEELIGCDNFVKNLSMKDLADLTKRCHYFISVDNFFHHMCDAWVKDIDGMVIFSRSDPKIFGHEKYTNVLKDEKYLRPDQFGMWKDCTFEKDAFFDAEYMFNLFKEKINEE